MTHFEASLIIPTYNRLSSLIEALEAVAHQSFPADCFEVIIVDDGSTDGTEKITERRYPFALRYANQTNQGDASARNFGAQIAQGEILIFIDDDIIIEPGYIEGIVKEHSGLQNTIILATIHNQIEDSFIPFQYWMGQISNSEDNLHPTFDKLCSNSMSIRRESYFHIGMMQSLGFPGSDIWCDVDFAYRADKLGYNFRRCPSAICFHKDHNILDRTIYQERLKIAAYRSSLLFKKYPTMIDRIPMFLDKRPISVRVDPLNLIIRKSIRSLISCYPFMRIMEVVTEIVEEKSPKSNFLKSLYRWLMGSYIYQGYRQGLREHEGSV